ncbi:hypothetical protein K3495_g15320, partial [Podosphaera aphanis]
MSDNNETSVSLKDAEFIENRINLYEKCDLKDLDLWESFQEDFAPFTTERFTAASRPIIQMLRTFLRKRGVYVLKKARIPIAQTLFEVIQQEEPKDWTDETIQEHLSSDGPFNSNHVNFLINTKLFPTEPQGLFNLPPLKSPPSPNVKNETKEADKNNDSFPNIESQFKQEFHEPPSTADFSRELISLAKLYTEEVKYSGENDNFDFKLAIFHDLCGRSGVQPFMMDQAFPTMLRGLALEHYYANMSVNKTASFEHKCESIRQYFEGPEYKRGVLATWNSTTLKSIINVNPGLPTQQCLKLFVKELRHLQHGLTPDLRNDSFLHNKLVSGCKMVPACQFACFKPSESLAGFINDLQSSIATYEELNEPQTNQTFFTDRKYYHRNTLNHQSTSHPLQKPSNDFNH